jgi:FAD/FMN-containing dehydrogenase
MRNVAPIIFFGYNRPDHARQTLEALSKSRLADESTLYIYVDGPKQNATEATIANIEAVKKVAVEKQWCKEVHVVAAPANKGLFRSIVDGITATVNKYGKVIVIEDDVLVSPGFLEYMNDALDFYENTEKVMHISAFSRPDLKPVPIKESTYFFYHTTCWGWATWKRAWDKFNPDPLAVKKAATAKGNISKLNMDGTFEFFWGLKAIAEGKFQSWNNIWHTTVFLNDGLCLHPSKSLVSNIGHDGSGTNCEPDEAFGVNNDLADKVSVEEIPLVEHAEVRAFYRRLHSFKYRFIFDVKHYLRYIFWR